MSIVRAARVAGSGVLLAVLAGLGCGEGGTGAPAGGAAGAGAAGGAGAGAGPPASLQHSALACHTAERTAIPKPQVHLAGFGPAEPVEAVNTACPDDAPEISADGQRLYLWFQTYHDASDPSVQFFDDTEIRAFFREGNGWLGPYVYPVDQGTEKSLDGEVSHTSAGDRVYFQSLRPENISWPKFDADVYAADVVGGVPQPAALLGPPVSTPQLDGEMCVSRDGQELFVSSDRDEPGKLRIYRFWWADGSWQGPEKLGAAVNSGAGDMQPFLMADESYLLWTSQRGGYPQIYRAARLGENEWGPAELVVSGPPVGSPSLTDDGRLLCFAALAPAMGGFEADVYCARAE